MNDTTKYEMNYITLYKSESYGLNGHFGLEIKVTAQDLPDLQLDSIRKAKNTAVKLIESSIRQEIKAKNKETPAEIAKNKELLTVFSTPIFVEEIENGYCSDWCCAHLPWFVVTTKVGRFTIGWRKRVISIDWNDTVGTDTAIVLFEDEDVTKGLMSIHAWSTEDAKRYIDTIISSAVVPS